MSPKWAVSTEESTEEVGPYSTPFTFTQTEFSGLHRLRARLQFNPGFGLAQWCHDQMTVRYEQAVHIRQGEPATEPKTNVVDGDLFYCDLPLMDEAAAEDALATLSAPTVLGVSVPLGSGGVANPAPSFVEYHLCDHAEDDRTGCVVVTRNEGPVGLSLVYATGTLLGGSSVLIAPNVQPWVQPTGAHDAYNTGDWVTHNGQTWESTVDANTWEPGVFGWVVV